MTPRAKEQAARTITLERTSMAAPGVAAAAPPQVAERYDIGGLLGVGGMASVYRAFDRELQEWVALKMLRHDLALDPAGLEQFRHEVKLARRIAHPNVARVFDIGEHDGGRFLTMELIVGESLASRLARLRVYPIRETLSVGIEVSKGLAAAHALGIVHRDLKPDNVMLAVDGRVVLTDFGIARAVSGAHTLSGDSLVGTPEYMAPEQVEGRGGIDGRADLYAFGVMLFEMLTGVQAWQADSPVAVAARRLLADPPEVTRHRHVPPRLAEIVTRCMARRREDRFASARELGEALEGCAAAYHPSEPHLARKVAPPPLREPRRVVAVMQAASTGSPGDAHLVGAFGDALFDILSSHPSVSAHLGPSRRGTDRDLRRRGRQLEAEVVVIPTLRLTPERELVASLRVVSVVEGLQLWGGTLGAPLADLFGLAADAAERVTQALVLAPPSRPVVHHVGSEGVDLLARARDDVASGAMFASDGAIAKLERLVAEGAGGDYWVLTTYAAALVRRVEDGDGIVEEALEAKSMAERAASLLPEAPLARSTLARLALELGEPSIATFDASLTRAPHPALERTLGLALADAGRLEEASERFGRALSLGEPRAPFDDARVRALLGEPTGRGLEGVAMATREHAFTAARLALWSADPGRLERVRTSLAAGPVPRRDALLAYLSVSPAYVAGAHALLEDEARSFTRLPRRAVLWFQLAAEAAAAAGDVPRALSSLRNAEASGLSDVGWLEHCPLFHAIRSEPDFRRIVAPARARALAALEALGLEEAR